MDINNNLNISLEEKLDEYNSFFKILEDSFPFYNLAKRFGINFTKIYNKYKIHLPSISNKKDYIKIYQDIIKEITGKKIVFGHLEIMPYKDNILNSISIYNNTSIYQDRYLGYIENLTKEKTLEFYEIELKDILKNIRDSYSNKQEDNINFKEELDWIQMGIIEENNIAYLRIKKFLKKDLHKNLILNFFKNFSNYKNIIIDIRNNIGGSTDYWIENIVSPNINENKYIDNYIFYRESKFTKGYWKYYTPYSKPINQLPNFDNLNIDDILCFDKFVHDHREIKPLFDEAIFKGKLWILSNDLNYSASEAFLQFCKRNNFATIVGEISGGDGIGTDPIFISLPNSGLILRYSFLYGLNSDGSCNEEFPTVPDIFNFKNKDALQTTLSIIKNNKIKILKK